jgi:hypothetical protein
MEIGKKSGDPPNTPKIRDQNLSLSFFWRDLARLADSKHLNLSASSA